ncbi:hypothetical protein TW65_05336 [Stemphylium lycopersici]|uniref:Carotenoid ester lipase-like protein n=1 Tax=Stemphylium lycopersici TaxID=183478 RepID=A0A364MX12_STELY|nr:hypothetical protein TW65_05336 [Stemphylium lycopersici]RAR05712.1 carotenoid ester lipase-like protein precursor [Stemphylium lycopersici]
MKLLVIIGALVSTLANARVVPSLDAAPRNLPRDAGINNTLSDHLYLGGTEPSTVHINAAPTKFDKAAEIGRTLDSAMKSKDSVARWFFKDFPNFHETCQSPFEGDGREELAKWGFDDSDELSKEVEKDCDFETYHHIEATFQELGLDTKAAKDGGPNKCFKINHRDGPAIKRLPDGSLPSEANQYYDVCGKEYRATGATYEFAVNPNGLGALMNIMSMAYCAEKFTWFRKPLPDELPHIGTPSDIAWANWNRAGASDIRDIKYLLVTQVMNAGSREIFTSALKTLQPPETTSSTLPPTISTTNGTLVGVRNTQYDQDFFLGVPYAEPPTGNLRYKRPEPIVGFSHEESEDCLTLNVVRPASAQNDSNLPVLVFVHGGGFQDGNGADQRYNMSFLVQESVNVGSPIIGVTINYRISGFGFLSGSKVHESGVTNLGLHDQRMALGWLQDNIAAFGGDASRVTIQGESAGAVSIGYHLVAYGGRDDGLFRASIAQSGGPAAVGMNISRSEQDRMYNDVLNQTGCMDSYDTLDCLRETSVDKLKAAFQGQLYFPVQDGDMIAENPFVALDEGRFLKRPLLAGTTTNEGTAFATDEGVSANTTTEFRNTIATYMGPGVPSTTVNAIAAEYLERMSPEDAQTYLGTVVPSLRPDYGLLYGRASLFRGDQLFIAPRRFSSAMWAKHGVPNYTYRFDTVPSGVSPELLGVAHYSEIPFVFYNVDGVGHEINFLAADSTQERDELVALGRRMSRMWISFVNEMQPNAEYALGGGNVTWPVYTNSNPVNMVFRKEGISVERDDWRAAAINRLNSAVAGFRVSMEICKSNLLAFSGTGRYWFMFAAF